MANLISCVCFLYCLLSVTDSRTTPGSPVVKIRILSSARLCDSPFIQSCYFIVFYYIIYFIQSYLLFTRVI